MDGRTLGRTMYFCLFSEKRAQPIDRRGHSAAHGYHGRYTKGVSIGGTMSTYAPSACGGRGVLWQRYRYPYRHSAAIARVGNSAVLPKPPAPGRSPHSWAKPFPGEGEATLAL
jgi:hypothetical protein